MATNFKLKRSSVASKRPGLTNLELGELALNTYDGFLFTERNGLGITTVTNLTPWYENYGAGSIFYSNKVGIGTTTVPDTNQLLVKGGTETDRLNVTGVTTVSTFNATGAATLNGNITLGDADTDNVVFNAEVNSHIIPNTHNTYDLGSATKQWRNIYYQNLIFFGYKNWLDSK